MRLGAHILLRGGWSAVPRVAAELGCEAIQVFLKNNVQWQGPPIRDHDARSFLAGLKDTEIKVWFAHSCYLINLASPERVIFTKSVSCLVDEIQRAEQLKIPYIVLHPGAHKGKGEQRGIRRVIQGFDQVFGRTPRTRVRILLESTAGQGTSLGWRFEQLAELIGGVRAGQQRMGVCLDTSHIFAAGYEFSSLRKYQKLMQEFDRIVGLEHLRVWHLNDSAAPLGSRRDRHQHIGQGYIGTRPFGYILNDKRFRELPMVIETPKGRGLDQDKRNLARLRSLIKR